MAQRVGGSPHSRLGRADGGCEPAAHDRLRHQRERLGLLQPQRARVAPDSAGDASYGAWDGRRVMSQATDEELTGRGERMAALLGERRIAHRGGHGDAEVESSFTEDGVKGWAERELKEAAGVGESMQEGAEQAVKHAARLQEGRCL